MEESVLDEQEVDLPIVPVPDANVLIDSIESDKEGLAVIAHHPAAIHVPSPVPAETRKLPA